MTNHDRRSRAVDELSAVVLRLLAPAPVHQSRVSAAGFASLLLGVSVAMMLCGSVTFVIGFLLMPWVLVVLATLYLVGVVSTISQFGRALLSPPSSSFPPDDVSGQIFSKCPII